MRDKSKISILSTNRVVIELYKTIYLISFETIEVDNYKVVGKNLKINRLNDYMIDITGEVDKVEIIYKSK